MLQRKVKLGKSGKKYLGGWEAYFIYGGQGSFTEKWEKHHANIRRKSIPGRRNSHCKSHEAGVRGVFREQRLMWREKPEEK